jgi:hypothetical protein
MNVMAWIKNVLLDLLVLVVAFVGALFDLTWAWWVLAIYTPLMLVLKVLALAGGTVLAQVGAGVDQPPTIFFHIVYGLIVLLMLYATWWLLAAGWAAIWAVSVMADRKRLQPVAKTRPGRR